MSPTTMQVLIGELLAAGIDVARIMADARADGRLSPELEAEIAAEVQRANERWEAAR